MGGFLGGGDPITLTVDASATLVTGGAPNDWHGRPAAEVVNGVVVMVYKTATAHNLNDGILHIKFSDDYGATWSDEDKTLAGVAVTNFPMNPPDLGAGEDCQEPWLITAPNGDLLLHMWKDDYGVTQHGTWQSRSTDDGATWTIPAQILPVGLAGPDGMFATDDHFVYNDVIYVVGRYFSANWADCKMLVIKSADNGTTWDWVSDITNNTPTVVEAGMEYVGNDTIVVVMRGNNLTWRSFSHDMGLTWTAAEDVSSSLWAIAGRHRINTGAHLRGEANWWNDTYLIMHGFIWTGTGRRPVLWISQDSGLTWAFAYQPVDVETADGGYCDMFYNPNTDQYVLLTYSGLTTAADVKQHNLTITGIT